MTATEPVRATCDDTRVTPPAIPCATPRATPRMGLMAGSHEDVTRFEVIDHAPGAVSYHPDVARSLVARDVKVELSVQDEGRTLKVFLTRIDAGERDPAA